MKRLAGIALALSITAGCGGHHQQCLGRDRDCARIVQPKDIPSWWLSMGKPNYSSSGVWENADDSVIALADSEDSTICELG